MTDQAREPAETVDSLEEAMLSIQYARRWLEDVADQEARDAISLCLRAAARHLQDYKNEGHK